MSHPYRALILGLTLLFSCTVQASAAHSTVHPAAPLAEDAVDSPQPIVLTLFLHDQLTPVELSSIGPDYMEWFLKELTEVTGRRINVITVTNKPGYTDLGYRLGDDVQSLRDWYERVVDYIEANNRPLSTQRHKYILVTRHKIAPDTLGIAFPNHGAAIASLRAYGTIAHEIGHLLGATHENAKTRFASALPCRTLMYPAHTEFFPSCYAFSDENRQAIRDYLMEGSPR